MEIEYAEPRCEPSPLSSTVSSSFSSRRHRSCHRRRPLSAFGGNTDVASRLRRSAAARSRTLASNNCPGMPQEAREAFRVSCAFTSDAERKRERKRVGERGRKRVGSPLDATATLIICSHYRENDQYRSARFIITFGDEENLKSLDNNLGMRATRISANFIPLKVRDAARMSHVNMVNCRAGLTCSVNYLPYFDTQEESPILRYNEENCEHCLAEGAISQILSRSSRAQHACTS
jgi:hypothetical protein